MPELSFHQPNLNEIQRRKELSKAEQLEAFNRRNLVQFAVGQRMTGVVEEAGKPLTEEEINKQIQWGLRYSPLFAELCLTNPGFEQAVMDANLNDPEEKDLEHIIQLLTENAPPTAEEGLH